MKKYYQYLTVFVCSLFYSCSLFFSCHAMELRDEQDLTEDLLSKGVIVRVWSGTLHGGESVGHVSLHTATDYISFWPDVNHKSGHFMANLGEDLAAENRDPEATIFLPHPVEDALEGIHQDFLFLKELLEARRLRWSLDGVVQSLKRSFTRESYDRGLNLLKPGHGLSGLSIEERRLLGVDEIWSFNCSSLVFNLLLNRQYIKNDRVGMRSAFNTAIAPDRVATVCSETFLLWNHRVSDTYQLYQFLDSQVRQRGESIRSDQIELFGRAVFVSRGSQVFYNRSYLDDIIQEIQRQKTEGIGSALGRMLVSHGITDLLAESLGPKNTASLLGTTTRKKPQ